MKRTPVSSSNIASIGYDAATRTLEVEFNDGSVYHYFGVPQSEYAGLMAAGSHGSYLAQHIKGSYSYSRV
jgi:hypothetical protein